MWAILRKRSDFSHERFIWRICDIKFHIFPNLMGNKCFKGILTIQIVWIDVFSVSLSFYCLKCHDCHCHDCLVAMFTLMTFFGSDKLFEFLHWFHQKYFEYNFKKIRFPPEIFWKYTVMKLRGGEFRIKRGTRIISFHLIPYWTRITNP